MPSRLIKRVRRVRRREGLAGAAKRLCIRAIGPLVARRKYFFVELDTAGPFTCLRRKQDGLVLARLSEDDVMAIAYVAKGKEQAFRRYLDHGASCYGMRLGNRTVAHVFAAAADIREFDSGIVVPVGPGQMYLFDAETDLTQRGKGVAIELIIRLAEAKHEEGVERFIAFIHDANRVARRTWRRIGFRPFRMFVHTRLLGGLIKVNRFTEPGADVDPL